MNKSTKIKELLNEGFTDRIIAIEVGCSIPMVSYVRRKLANALGKSAYVPIHHVHMSIGPWTVETDGVLSREIRGT